MTDPILSIRNLHVGLLGKGSVDPVLSAIDLDVRAGEILGVAGESGSGKSTLAACLLGLTEAPMSVREGSVLFKKDESAPPIDLLRLPEWKWREIRWRDVAYVPQSSMSALNPVLRIGRQITDAMVCRGIDGREADRRARASLERVNLENSVLKRYPHELSGGMLQRISIACAISMEPRVLIADEPTTALDVVTQRMILEELTRARDELATTILLISHDMGVMAQVTDRVGVLYAGRLVELADTRSLFQSPLHPYVGTLVGALCHARPSLAPATRIPNPRNRPKGCPFHPHCREAMKICEREVPRLGHHDGRLTACHLYLPEAGR